MYNFDCQVSRAKRASEGLFNQYPPNKYTKSQLKTTDKNYELTRLHTVACILKKLTIILKMGFPHMYDDKKRRGRFSGGMGF